MAKVDISDGDLVTFLYSNGETTSAVAEIIPSVHGRKRIRATGTDYATWFFVDEEGVRWARGHGEEVGRALRAAALLRKTA